MKRKLTMIITASVLLFGLPGMVHAQVAVIDAASLGETIRKFIHDKTYQAQALMSFGESVARAQELNDMVHSTYNLISRLTTDAKIVTDLYDNYNALYSDVQSVTSFYNRIANGNVSLYDVEYGYELLNKVGSDALDEMDYVVSTLLSPSENMSASDRLDKLSEVNKRFRQDRYLIDRFVNTKTVEVEKAEMSRQISEAVANAYGLNSTSLEGFDESKLKNITALTEPRRVLDDGDGTSFTSESLRDNSLGARVVDIVSIVIGILGALFAAWNYGKVMHGNRQNTDALWKVFSGMLVSILMLQALKNIFF